MAGRDYHLSEESLSILEPYVALPLNDVRRAELLSFLVEAVDDPNRVAFEQDDEGLRWTWLDHVAVVWKVDLVELEVDLIDAWDEGADT